MKNIFFLFVLLSSYTFSQEIYVPNNNASLASSQDCYNKMQEAVDTGNQSYFQKLIDGGCVLIYNSNKHNLELVLYKVGGMTEPNIYYIKGMPNAKIWALRSQVSRK